MKIKLNCNIITGVVFLVISVVLGCLIPTQIKTYETGSMTAATVPTLLIRILLACSVILLLQGLVSKNKKEYCISVLLFRREYLKCLRPVIYIVMLLVYAVLMPRIGFIIASLLLTNGVLAYYGTRKWLFYLIATANVFFAYFMFRFINVTLP